VRALFISDLHIGSPDCLSAAVLAMLRRVRPDAIYLIGDIVDSWYVKEWPADHEIVRRVGELAAGGARVIYIPGNHDAFMRGATLAGIEIVDQATYVARDGRQYLVVHGDRHDRFLWLSFLHWFPLSRRWRARFHRAFAAVDRTDAAIMRAATSVGVDGVICGHTHAAMDVEMGVRYLNCGDWVGSCTAVIERMDGTMALIGGVAA
jgi:UDP-2,3-diacylglucosamine pyrophosphatase LpxH